VLLAEEDAALLESPQDDLRRERGQLDAAAHEDAGQAVPEDAQQVVAEGREYE
jgi:hypothetical protein